MNLVRTQFLQKTTSFIYSKTKIGRLALPVRAYAKSTAKQKDDILAEEGPVKFSSSKASKWQASRSRSGDNNQRLWYEPYVILGSIFVFMTYFAIIREENDIDQELTRSLYSRIEGLEEQQLRISLEYNLDHNLPTADIVARLKELEEEAKR